YPKLRKGYITVFPNNIADLGTRILPYPIVELLKFIKVVFTIDRDLSSLIANNPLYKDIIISEINIETYKGIDRINIPRYLYKEVTRERRTAKDLV
ncbi:hypothetical protein QBC39DRAFT_265875, partial [Podospora conica]